MSVSGTARQAVDRMGELHEKAIRGWRKRWMMERASRAKIAAEMTRLAERTGALATLLGGTTPLSVEEAQLAADEAEDITTRLGELADNELCQLAGARG